MSDFIKQFTFYLFLFGSLALVILAVTEGSIIYAGLALIAILFSVTIASINK